MRLSGVFWRWLIILALVLPGGLALQPAAAQGPDEPIEELALRAHAQNLRSHSYTDWIGGPLGDVTQAPPATVVGDSLTGWGLSGLAGDEDLLASDLTRPVLLNFWASWCYPCQLEFPHLVEVATAPDDHTFDVVFVNIWDTETDALAYLGGFPDTLYTVLDKSDRLANRSGIVSIPTSLLLDTDGTVLAAHIGLMTPTITAFFDAVAADPGAGSFMAADHMDVSLEAVLLPVEADSAAPIQLGEPASGTLTEEEYQQAYRFEGRAGQVVQITLQADNSELDPYVVLMTADGTHIAENDDISPGVIQDSNLTATLPADGVYLVVATRFLEAEGYSVGEYLLTVSEDGAAPPDGALPPPQPDNPTIAYGQTVTGTLDDTNYEDRWSFIGQRGDVIGVVMTRTVDELGGLDGYLILEGPDGDKLIEADDSPDGVMPTIERFELAADGTYTIVATRFGFANGFSTGEYTLTLDKQGAISTTAVGDQSGGNGGPGIHWLTPGTLPPGLRWIAYHDPVNGTIARDNVDDWTIFRGREGDVITVRMTASTGDLDAFVILTDANGVELARNDDATAGSKDAAITEFTLPVADAYLIRATRYGFENGPSSGDYTLVIETEAEPLAFSDSSEPIAQMDYRQPMVGALSLDKSRDRYTLAGKAEDWITVGVRRTSGDLDLALALVAPDGTLIADDRGWSGSPEARITQVQLPQDGLYAVDVILEDLTTTGDYELIALPAPSGEVDPGAFVPAEGLDIELVLIWASGADLNLAVYDFGADTESQQTARANDFCASVSYTPVERIVWDDGAAAPGLYEIRVRYELNCDGQTEPISFILAIARNGEVVDLIGGTLAREGDQYVTMFNYAR
jgi:thiol-disulfide isomerase/thioredoxin